MSQAITGPRGAAQRGPLPGASRHVSIFSQLTRWQKFGLIFLWSFALGYGCFVEIRGALLKSRHTDVDTYFRAAWAVRNGTDLYTITDTNGWHYIYPPLFAILISPLADPPEEMSRHGYLPYEYSVGAWYLISVACFVAGVVMLARRLEKTLDEESSISLSPQKPPALPWDQTANTSHRTAVSFVNASRWWALRFWPVLLCLPVTCRSVIRGQVGPLWLLLTCGMIAALLARKPMRAGLWLAGAICLKVIPLYLLLYPMWRRSYRMLAGCAAGLFAGLVVIPLIAMGPERFTAASKHYVEQFILPGAFGSRIDSSVERELMNPAVSDHQSFSAVLSNIGHSVFGVEQRFEKPLAIKIAHVLIGGTMTVLTLLAAGWWRRARRADDPQTDVISEALFVALLVLVMLPIAPVTHCHYFMVLLPLISVLWAIFYQPAEPTRLTAGWIALLAALPLSHIITAIKGLEVTRETGLVTWVSVVVWAAATKTLWRRTRFVPIAIS